MIFIAILGAALILYAIQSRLYGRHALERVQYEIRLSADEVFEGEDVFLYEELTNAKKLPLPSVRVDTELPEGLYFRLRESGGRERETLTGYHESAFVLRGEQKIRRRWRVCCRKRGRYTLGAARMVTGDLFGTGTLSSAVEPGRHRYNQIVVLPKTLDLDAHFTTSCYQSGEIPVMRSLLTDPLLISGSRDYTPLDPLRKIDWNSTAVHGRLMVRVEDYTEQPMFNIVLNMQSRPMELHPQTPSAPAFVELCITVCASLLDRVAQRNIPVRLLVNTDPAAVEGEALSGDEIGSRILTAGPYRGRGDQMRALRMLAVLPLTISCPFDKMLDHMIEHPSCYTGGGNLIIVSSYIDERMIVFHDIAKKMGVKVIFYITSTAQNAMLAPERVEVYYRTYGDA